MYFNKCVPYFARGKYIIDTNGMYNSFPFTIVTINIPFNPYNAPLGNINISFINNANYTEDELSTAIQKISKISFNLKAISEEYEIMPYEYLPIPKCTVHDAGKVLKVNSNGKPEWVDI